MQARIAPQPRQRGAGGATPHDIAGVPVQTLATTYGTPLLAIDLDIFDRNVARFEALHAELGIDVSYAGKAFLVIALARRLVRTTLGLDVCSLGELVTAERAAFPAPRLTMHGCAKTGDELRAAAEGRVGRLVIDNHAEIERLAAYAQPRRPLSVLLRVNTGIEAHTHAHVRTGGAASKFGLAPQSVPAAIAAVGSVPGLRFVGLHSHLGSQIFDAEPYRASLDVLLDLCHVAASQEAPQLELIIGGGFGVAPTDCAAGVDVAGILRELARDCAQGARARGIRTPRLGIEPGRAIVAAAGTSLYCVAVGKLQGERRFAIVDGGIADNPRPALYGAFHEPALAGRTTSAPLAETTVCGRSCENDQLAVAPLPLDLRPGDLLTMATTGAYTFSMASNYNRFPRPAVVFIENGAHRLAVRRESEDDVMRNDVDDMADSGA
ncbi:MAG: diaminopimelate decarboxylase [Candidatus Eremiobacteraeota bacterium]|nr:diaminopimelate decarboxylase [Candidatus Eremiobacteraeota bacterium]